MTDTEKTVPFSLPVNVRTLPKKGQNVVYEAPADVCAKIANSYDLISVESFSATCLLAPWKKDGVKLTGQVNAEITQPCAVTFEPLTASINEPVDMIFVAAGSRLARPAVNDEGEIIFDPDGDDLPEMFTGDSIDVAAVWLEFFVLGLDLFARQDGAALKIEAGQEATESPFAALDALKKH